MAQSVQPVVPPAPETRCVLCQRIREIGGNTTWCGIFHGRWRRATPHTGEMQIGFDWICYKCVSEKSLLEYFSVIYGADYVQMMITD